MVDAVHPAMFVETSPATAARRGNSNAETAADMTSVARFMLRRISSILIKCLGNCRRLGRKLASCFNGASPKENGESEAPHSRPIVRAEGP